MALSEWMQQASKELGSDPAKLGTQHPYGFLKALFTEADLPPSPIVLPGVPGSPRGAYATMYVNRPWTQRQYAGYGDAIQTNSLYRRMFDQGSRGFSVAFDLPTHLGFDSSDERVRSEVGMSGVALDSAGDFAILFRSIPLDQVSVSMTMNGAVLQSIASLYLAAKAQGVDPKLIRGTIQNDPLKEFAARNTEIFALDPSMRITRDIIAFCAREMPKFNPISISGYHYHEAGAHLHQELGFMLAGGIEYVKMMEDYGMDVDDFAPQLSFFYSIGIDFWGEVAKLRAGRVLWNEYMEDLGAQDPASKIFKFHSHTSGVSLQAQDPIVNVARATIEAMAGVLGGTQSMHISSFDEAVGLPSEESLRISTATHYLLREESRIANVVDPLGGSYFIEAATSLMAGAANNVVQEILRRGGMKKAVESGYIEELIAMAASERQAAIDSGETPIVGVNTFVGETPPLEPRRVEASQVLRTQLSMIDELREVRDESKLNRKLDDLTRAAKTDTNLVPLVIEAMGPGCATWGEVTSALSKVLEPRKRRSITADGVYADGMKNNPRFLDAKRRCETAKIARLDSPLRMLLVTPGLDGHDRGPNVVADAFRSLGFEVEWDGVIALTPQQIVEKLKAEPFEVLGVSTHSGTHVAYMGDLNQRLIDSGFDGSLVKVVGGVIPLEDYGLLKDAGVDVIIPQGMVISDAANKIMDSLGIPRIVDSPSRPNVQVDPIERTVTG